MSKLSVLKDIVHIVETALTAAAPVVEAFNPVIGGILVAIGKTATYVEQIGVGMPAPEKKQTFERLITSALIEELGDKATPELIAAVTPSIDALITLVNSLSEATKPPA